jgi:hypothetical protein
MLVAGDTNAGPRLFDPGNLTEEIRMLVSPKVVFIWILVLSSPGFAQKIETSRAVQNQIIRIETSLNHLTVIEVPEPISMVAVGSPSFKVERRDNKVFIQPLEEGQSTNLFIWTTSTRYNYELGPAGDVAGMHFAIDHTAPDISVSQGVLDTLHQAASVIDSTATVSRALVESIPVKSERTASSNKGVTVVIKDIFKMQDRLLIRYGIQNHGRATYNVETPRVTLLGEPRSRHSLIPLSHTQLSERDAARLTKKGETRLEIVQTEVGRKCIKPGEQTVGLVGIRPINDRAVIQLRFPADQKGLVIAIMVL